MDNHLDPGSAEYGNFINYYSFNSAEERLKLLPFGGNKFWSESEISASVTESESEYYMVLDIGCNAGNFTQLLFPYISNQLCTGQKIKILGIDIDPLLIERSNEHNRYDDVTYYCGDIMERETEVYLRNYLEKFGKTKFDSTFCLSITMWIHLHNGDEGLRQFLHKTHSLTLLLIIEPQPWKCYITAGRRRRKAGQPNYHMFSELEWRTDVDRQIKNYLTDLCRRKLVYETEPTKWSRKLSFYRF